MRVYRSVGHIPIGETTTHPERRNVLDWLGGLDADQGRAELKPLRWHNFRGDFVITGLSEDIENPENQIRDLKETR